jgi:hypothetical protein
MDFFTIYFWTSFTHSGILLSATLGWKYDFGTIVSDLNWTCWGYWSGCPWSVAGWGVLFFFLPLITGTAFRIIREFVGANPNYPVSKWSPISFVHSHAWAARSDRSSWWFLIEEAKSAHLEHWFVSCATVKVHQAMRNCASPCYRKNCASLWRIGW